MNRIDYEGSVIPGGIEAFDGVINLKKSETEVGESPVPSPDAARTYARFVESIIDAQQAAEEDDGQPLAVVTGRDGITRVRRPRQRQSAPNVLTLKVENDVGGPTSLPLPAESTRGILRIVRIAHNHMAGRPADYGLAEQPTHKP